MPGLSPSSNPEELLLAALERGGDVFQTGRYLVTFKEAATDAGVEMFRARAGFRTASARDFEGGAMSLEAVGDADAAVFPEIGVALVGGEAYEGGALSVEAVAAADSPVHSVDPEYFMFSADIDPTDYLRGFLRAAQAIASDLGAPGTGQGPGADVSPEAVGATWGLTACLVPASPPSGNGIKVAVLDTGLDLGHPEFAGRVIVSNTFVGQPVQDLHGHGTHTAGTACGPKNWPNAYPRYGIAYQSQIYAGKVLTNSGSGTMASVLAGINWAIANQCQVISMSLGAPIPVQPAYTNAGQAALNQNCLLIAAAGNESHRPTTVAPTGAPANSLTVVSVAAVDSLLKVAPFSNGGKVDIAGPGVNVFSSFPRPTLHKTMSGTSMATPHVSGVAALWAHSSPALRGAPLRAKLLATAKHLPLPASDVGAGLVQAPPWVSPLAA